MSHVFCHVSRVACHLSPVTCPLSPVNNTNFQSHRPSNSSIKHSRLVAKTNKNLTNRSKICVQSQSRLVLDRLDGMGGGTGEAARRRGRKAWLERKWDNEQQAQESAPESTTCDVETSTTHFPVSFGPIFQIFV